MLCHRALLRPFLGSTRDVDSRWHEVAGRRDVGLFHRRMPGLGKPVQRSKAGCDMRETITCAGTGATLRAFRRVAEQNVAT